MQKDASLKWLDLVNVELAVVIEFAVVIGIVDNVKTGKTKDCKARTANVNIGTVKAENVT